MPEREKRFSRREFLFGGIGALLTLAGCELKADQSVIPERPEPEKKKEDTPVVKAVSPLPQESPYRPDILSTQASEEKEETWSLKEIQDHYPLVIENLSSFRIEGVYHQRLAEVMKEVEVNEGQFLG